MGKRKCKDGNVRNVGARLAEGRNVLDEEEYLFNNECDDLDVAAKNETEGKLQLPGDHEPPVVVEPAGEVGGKLTVARKGTHSKERTKTAHVRSKFNHRAA